MGIPVGVKGGSHWLRTRAAFLLGATLSSDLRAHTVSVVGSWCLVDSFHQWLWVASIIWSGLLHMDVGVRHIQQTNPDPSLLSKSQYAGNMPQLDSEAGHNLAITVVKLFDTRAM